MAYKRKIQENLITVRHACRLCRELRSRRRRTSSIGVNVPVPIFSTKSQDWSCSALCGRPHYMSALGWRTVLACEETLSDPIVVAISADTRTHLDSLRRRLQREYSDHLLKPGDLHDDERVLETSASESVTWPQNRCVSRDHLSCVSPAKTSASGDGRHSRQTAQYKLATAYPRWTARLSRPGCETAITAGRHRRKTFDWPSAVTSTLPPQ